MLNQNDKAFYSDNGQGLTAYSGIAFQTIKDLGLTPLIYGGTGIDCRESNLDKEMRDGFYESKVIIIYIGEGLKWRGVNDNWAIPELEHAIARGTACLFYYVESIHKKELPRLPLHITSVPIRDEDHFKNTLMKDLRQFML